MPENQDYQKKNEDSGNLYSVEKQGKPKGAQLVLSFGYLISLTLLTILTATLAFLPKAQKNFNWKVFSVFFTACVLSGYVFGGILEHADPNFPGWMFFSWATTFHAHSVLFVLEDWLFYPLCASLFYFMYCLFKAEKPTLISPLCGTILATIHGAAFLFFALCGALAGKLLAFMYAGPAIVMMIYCAREWDLVVYLKIGIVMIGLGFVWDMVGVNLLHHYWAWCQWWAYITFDATGNPHHSKVFLDYTTHRWAWLWGSPIEITPWMAVSSWPFVYFGIRTLEKVFKKN